MHTTKIIYDIAIREGVYPGDDDFWASFLDAWELCPMAMSWRVHATNSDEIEFVPADKSIKVPI